MEMKEFYKDIIYPQTEVDDWVAGKTYRLQKVDSELGWLYRTGRIKDGVDESICAYSYDKTGARHLIMYADKPCRVNTYGNSFTHCNQVSDGETWQEILAAHLGEPIRNFGIGNHSVYQAYLRMKREEKRTPAEHIIFNIYDNDHYRSLSGLSNIRFNNLTGFGNLRKWKPGFVFPTAPYVEANPATGEFTERQNLCPTLKSYYNLCSLDWVYEMFKDDFTMKLMLARANAKEGNSERFFAEIMAFASKYGIKTRIDNAEKIIKTIDELYNNVAFFVSKCIVEKVEEFATANKKKVLYVLSYSVRNISRKLKSGYRFDQEFVDFLQKKGLPYVDLMDAHKKEFDSFKTSVEDYIKRYYIGHYNPRGNFFQAFAIKNKMVEILKPKPTSYQKELAYQRDIV
jgi:hypothetical protein